MPTRRGWLLALGAVVLAAAGRLLAVLELTLAGAGGLALVAAAVAYTRLAGHRLEATRQPRPPRLHAGAASRIELTVRNAGTRGSPLVTARDPFDGGRRWARFLLAPLPPGETARAAYRVPTDQRGVYDLGPLRLEVGDPFGLSTRARIGAPVTKLTVYPRIDRIDPLPFTQGHDASSASDHPTALGAAGEDFYALREYDVGDDLRRVHWKSTAKLDELMIRQDEMPWQGRITVLLDLRQSVHSPASVEVAVSAAASIVAAHWRRRSLVRLVTSEGTDSGFASGQGHVEAVLERLAWVTAHAGSELGAVMEDLRRRGSGSLVVITTAAAPGPDLARAGRLRSRFGAVTTVLLERSVLDPSKPSEPAPGPAGSSLVRVSAAEPFAAAWTRATRARSARAGAGRR